MKVAIIHYWLVQMRGGEKVVEALCEMFPEADVFTHVYDPSQISPTIRRHRVRTTFIARLPYARRLYQAYLPLMPFALEQLDLRDYDLVISSESGPAKGGTDPSRCLPHLLLPYADALHMEYVSEYRQDANPLVRALIPLIAHRLRQWDGLSAARVDHFVANSRNVLQRVRKYYRRDAAVIHPPVDTDRFAPAPTVATDGFYLYAGQLIGYKQVALAIEAFNRLRKPLVIVGDGNQRAELVRLAGPTIHFRGRVSDDALRDAYVNCRALVFPGEEDFGIVPLEAMATGRPVLAFGRGGVVETVIPGQTGLLFSQQTPEALMQAVAQFEQAAHLFDPQDISLHANSFSKRRFKQQMGAFIHQALSSDNAGNDRVF